MSRERRRKPPEKDRYPLEAIRKTRGELQADFADWLGLDVTRYRQLVGAFSGISWAEARRIERKVKGQVTAQRIFDWQERYCLRPKRRRA